jgi:hypothetical protein
MSIRSGLTEAGGDTTLDKKRGTRHGMCREAQIENHTPADVSQSIMPNFVHHNEMDRTEVANVK